LTTKLYSITLNGTTRLRATEKMPSTNPRRAILPIPQNKTPEDIVCFCLFLPDDREHFAAFWGALGALAAYQSWGKPLSEDSYIVAAFWDSIIQDNRALFEASL